MPNPLSIRVKITDRFNCQKDACVECEKRVVLKLRFNSEESSSSNNCFFFYFNQGLMHSVAR